MNSPACPTVPPSSPGCSHTGSNLTVQNSGTVSTDFRGLAHLLPKFYPTTALKPHNLVWSFHSDGQPSLLFLRNDVLYSASPPTWTPAPLFTPGVSFPPSRDEELQRERRRAPPTGICDLFLASRVSCLLLPSSGSQCTLLHLPTRSTTTLFPSKPGAGMEDRHGAPSLAIDPSLGTLDVPKVVPSADAPFLNPRLCPYDPNVVTFVHNNNIYYRYTAAGDLSCPVEVMYCPLTSLGAGDITVGLADFISAEELGRHQGYWWAPRPVDITSCGAAVSSVYALAVVVVDSTAVASIASDHFDAVTSASTRCGAMTFPKPGCTNATWRICLLLFLPLGGFEPQLVPLQLPLRDEYLLRVAWSPDAKSLLIVTANRVQTAITYRRVPVEVLLGPPVAFGPTDESATTIDELIFSHRFVENCPSIFMHAVWHSQTSDVILRVVQPTAWCTLPDGPGAVFLGEDGTLVTSAEVAGDGLFRRVIVCFPCQRGTDTLLPSPHLQPGPDYCAIVLGPSASVTLQAPSTNTLPPDTAFDFDVCSCQIMVFPSVGLIVTCVAVPATEHQIAVFRYLDAEGHPVRQDSIAASMELLSSPGTSVDTFTCSLSDTQTLCVAWLCSSIAVPPILYVATAPFIHSIRQEEGAHHHCLRASLHPRPINFEVPTQDCGKHEDANLCTCNRETVNKRTALTLSSLCTACMMAASKPAASLPFCTPVFVDVPLTDGRTSNALIYLPPESIPGRCPVLLYVYGGPGVQLVTNAWHQSCNAYFNLLVAIFGMAIIVIDGRGSHKRGLKFEAAIRWNLGTVEVDDQLTALSFLCRCSEFSDRLDSSRIAVEGWSYGGYMATKLLAVAPEIFTVALAGAGPTDWLHYDSAWTERYLGLPSENSNGYQCSSLLSIVDKIPDTEPPRLIILHGMKDENVHFSHTVQLLAALVRATSMFFAYRFVLSVTGRPISTVYHTSE